MLVNIYNYINTTVHIPALIPGTTPTVAYEQVILSLIIHKKNYILKNEKFEDLII